jgi:hypothetical protein
VINMGAAPIRFQIIAMFESETHCLRSSRFICGALCNGLYAKKIIIFGGVKGRPS